MKKQNKCPCRYEGEDKCHHEDCKICQPNEIGMTIEYWLNLLISTFEAVPLTKRQQDEIELCMNKIRELSE